MSRTYRKESNRFLKVVERTKNELKIKHTNRFLAKDSREQFLEWLYADDIETKLEVITQDNVIHVSFKDKLIQSIETVGNAVKGLFKQAA